MQVLRALGVGVLVAGLAFVGCGGGGDEGDDEMAPDTVTMEGAMDETVDETDDVVEETGEAIGEGVEEIGDKVEDAADATN
jgi:hypothetical protein